MKKLSAVALLFVLSLGVACNTSWLATFEGYLKIAGPILIQILDIVALAKGVPVSPALTAKINADQVALNSLAASVDKATQADLPTTCAAFNQAVATFAGDLTAIEQLGNVGPNTAGEIGAIVGIAQAAIQEIEVPLVACAAAPTPATAMVKLRLGALKVSGPNATLRRYNALVDSRHRVHLHSLPVRVLTLGRLQ
jgi:hypothetical protein